MDDSKFEKVQSAFWIIYILIPMFSGWMAYQYLPGEYDERKHELLESHSIECGTEGMQSCEVADKWRDNNTGEIYIASQFTSHRRAEAARISTITFAYGLIGCLFSAYGRLVRERNSMIRDMQEMGRAYIPQDFKQHMRQTFIDSFKTALGIDFIISLFFYLII